MLEIWARYDRRMLSKCLKSMGCHDDHFYRPHIHQYGRIIETGYLCRYLFILWMLYRREEIVTHMYKLFKSNLYPVDFNHFLNTLSYSSISNPNLKHMKNISLFFSGQNLGL